MKSSTSITKYYHNSPQFRFNLITADPDDNKFVDCAIIAQADYIFTNDRHFEEVKECPFPKTNVVSLRTFSDSIK